MNRRNAELLHLGCHNCSDAFKKVSSLFVGIGLRNQSLTNSLTIEVIYFNLKF